MSRKIILKQHQSPGDILTMTRAVADLKQNYPDWLIDVRTPCPEIWEHNPHLTPLKEKDSGVEVYGVEYGRDNKEGIHTSGWRGQHWTTSYREDIEQQVGADIVQTSIKPELYLSHEEQHWINQVEVEFGWHGGFWLINAGRKDDNELKQYHRWQEVVDILNKYFNGRVKLVQIGSSKPHIHPELKGVYNLVGKTDLRQLIRLCWWAHGTVGPLSFQFVMAAAFGQPHVVVAGGKEGVRWHIYPWGRYINTNGALKCCKEDGCWLGGDKGKCKDLVGGVPHCFRLIEPYMIADAVKMYYEGGILGWGRGK